MLEEENPQKSRTRFLSAFCGNTKRSNHETAATKESKKDPSALLSSKFCGESKNLTTWGRRKRKTKEKAKKKKESTFLLFI